MTALTLPPVVADDSRDAELLAAGMLMFRDGLLDTVNLDDLARLSGKPLGALDEQARTNLLLLKHGYRGHNISVEPDLTSPLTFDEWVGYLQRTSDSPFDGAVLEQLRRQHDLLAVWQRNLIHQKASFPGRLTHERRRPMLADADSLLADGWTIQVRLGGRPGWAVYGLVFEPTGSGYLTFDPMRGLVTLDANVFGGVIRDLHAWRLS